MIHVLPLFMKPFTNGSIFMAKLVLRFLPFPLFYHFIFFKFRICSFQVLSMVAMQWQIYKMFLEMWENHVKFQLVRILVDLWCWIFWHLISSCPITSTLVRSRYLVFVIIMARKCTVSNGSDVWSTQCRLINCCNSLE